jgi:hypothetical protein
VREGARVCLVEHGLAIQKLQGAALTYKWQLVDSHKDVPVSRDLHVTHTRIYHKQRTLQASYEKYSHSNRYEPR